VRRVNLFDTQPGYEDTDPAGFRAAVTRVGRELGSEELSFNLYEIPPGESLTATATTGTASCSSG
jgi:hypothetical protein